MRKTIKSILLILMLCVAVVSSPIASQEANATSVSDKSVYWLTGYGSGGYCTLSANIYMIRRAMIARGSTQWANVTYKSAGSALCTSVPSMKWHYTYSCDGVTVKGEHIALSGSASQKAAKLRSMLNSHPEGVVVRGNRLAGYSHGALLTGYYGTGNNQFYVADSTHNASKFVKSPKGIETWASSTLNDVSNVQDVWYLASISGIAKSARNVFVTVNGQTYYMDGNNAKATGWRTISGKKYYFSTSDGHMLKGWQTIDGKRYYLDASNGAAAVDCTKAVNGKTFIFDKDGAVVEGWYTNENGTYYCDINDGLAFGYNIIDGEAVYFDEKSGVMSTANDVDIQYCFGASRYDTALKLAAVLKYQKKADSFENIVVASGENYPDALSGGCLADEKNAPMILVGKSNEAQIADYVKANLADNGTVYILGGTGAVSQKFEDSLDCSVERLAGSSRYDTNLKILNESEKESDTILVCSGASYADSLSASGLKKPIIMADKALTDEQLTFIDQFDNVIIVGGTGAVNQTVEDQIRNLRKTEADEEDASVDEEQSSPEEETVPEENFVPENQQNIERIAGATRFETSQKLAEHFFSKGDKAIIVYGLNFPDGLSAAPLAAYSDSPIILATATDTDYAAAAAEKIGIKQLFIIGGPSLISRGAAERIIGK